MKDKRLYKTTHIDSLKDIIDISCINYKDRIAFMEKRKGDKEFTKISFGEFREDVIAFGTFLNEKLGIENLKVAVIGENSYHWYITYMATVCGNGVIVPLDKELPANEIENLIHRSEAKVLVYSHRRKEIVDGIRHKLKSVKLFICMYPDETDDMTNTLSMEECINVGQETKKVDDRYINIKVDRNKMSMLLFTSGTTSTSKAVMLSHKNIANNIEHANQCIKEYPSDRVISILPVHHTFECTTNLYSMYNGVTLAFSQGLKYVVSDMKELSPTAMVAVPLLVEKIYDKIWSTIKKQGKENLVNKMIKLTNSLPVSKNMKDKIKHMIFKDIYSALGGRLRMILIGAAPLNPEINKGLADLGLICIEGYGLTETAPVITVGHDKYNKPGSVGFPTEMVEVAIDNPDEDGIGEIKARGDNIMLGYYKDDEETHKAIRDGWFYTGDLGYIDKDGYLFISGRIKNVIVTKNGKKIFPEEIENMLNEYGIIKESMVYGFEDDDDDVTVSADIVVDKEYIEANKLSMEEVSKKVKEIIKATNAKLVSYKAVKKFDIRENEFVKTTTMKIKRYIENMSRNNKNKSNDN